MKVISRHNLDITDKSSKNFFNPIKHSKVKSKIKTVCYSRYKVGWYSKKEKQGKKVVLINSATIHGPWSHLPEVDVRHASQSRRQGRLNSLLADAEKLTLSEIWASEAQLFLIRVSVKAHAFTRFSYIPWGLLPIHAL